MDFTPITILAQAAINGPVSMPILAKVESVELCFTRTYLQVVARDEYGQVCNVREWRLPKRNPHRAIYGLLLSR